MAASKDPTATKNNQGWTLRLVLCLIVTCTAQFQYGFNIGVTNLPTPIIRSFMLQDKIDLLANKTEEFNFKKSIYDTKYGQYAEGLKQYLEGEQKYADGMVLMNKTKAALAKFEAEGNWTAYNIIYEKALEKNLEYMDQHGMTVEQFLQDARFKLDLGKKKIENASALLSAGKIRLDEGESKLNEGSKKLNFALELLWTTTNALFVLGGMIGAICSKPLADFFGRRNSIIVHNVFSLIGAALILLTYEVPHFTLIMISRFFYGVQGGMACSLTPSYLMEISPSKLRGATGVFNQLCLTLGIMISQLLGFRQILGTTKCWQILLGLPLVMSLFCSLFLGLFEETTPGTWRKSKKYDPTGASIGLTEKEAEIKQPSSNENSDALTFVQLFKIRNLRWPLITGIVLQLAQQLSGINAIFFYSGSIFKNSGIQADQIQYAILLTGIINVVATIIAIPLIEKLGRKPLLVYPMIAMTVVFIVLTVFLIFQDQSSVFSYMSIACIVVFIICFAVGLGPIPFVYVAECFKQNAKSAAMAVCMLTNWFSNLLLTLAFPYLARFLGNYVFLVFTAIVGLLVTVIIFKVPETKNKNQDEIMAEFTGESFTNDDALLKKSMLSVA